MPKQKLNTVTLIGIDCLDLTRLNFAMEICQKDFEFADVKILSSLPPVDQEIITKIDPINSARGYSSFIINELHNYIDTKHALIVQYDGFILNPKAWSGEFLKYDHIGAPWLVSDWSVEKFDFPIDLLGQMVVGNGGFSLRSKKLLELTAKLSKENKLPKYHPEDVAICVYYRKLFENHGIKFAPVNLAKQFSYEAIDNVDISWDGQFGFHGLNWTDISKWTKTHPEYNIENPAAQARETTYKGDIIEESLENKNILNELKIINTKISEVTPKHQTPWLNKWHLHEIEIEGYRKAEAIAEKLKKAMESDHQWYADYKNTTTHYIIFKDKVFRIDRTSFDQYKEASNHGISLGIPAHQVDFTKDLIIK